MADTALQPVKSPAAWHGSEMTDRAGEWTQTLSNAEIAELYDLARSLRARSNDLLDLTRGDVPLPILGERLAALRHELLHGRGFALLRGMPVEEHTLADNAWAYWTLGLHLGTAVPQNGKNHMLGHVTDLGLDYTKPDVRGYQTSERLPYHTDYSDIVGLLCIRAARRGGLSSIASSVAIYNEMVRRHPDLAAALTRPIARTRWGEVPAGQQPWAMVPIFMPGDGRVITTYVRSAVRKGQSLDGVPPVTAEQEAAFDAIDQMAADPAFHLDMDFQPGDMQFLNNHVILHSRTTYEDHADPAKRRHLLRLWLACDDGPPLPKVMIDDAFQGGTRTGRPNGISVDGIAPIATLDPLAEMRLS
ncbi:MAG: TauD/TfdA family dioxygenase [Hyphomicrobiaceae bacterium]